MAPHPYPDTQRSYGPSSVPPSSTSLLLQPTAQGPSAPSPNSPLSIRSRRSSASVGYEGVPPSISDKYSLPLDPRDISSSLALDRPEPDDALHNPDPKRDHRTDRGGTILTSRGLINVGFITLLALIIIGLFAGYPIVSYFTRKLPTILVGFNLGLNASGQVPDMMGGWALVDPATPDSARFKTDYMTGKQWQLIFSDEFNTDDRSFYPGDDPYWEAVDLHYWQTNNLEWYDPKAITTRNGSLEITLSDEENHNLSYTGGMMSTWNKFCFTGGLVEASVVLPGANNVKGLWPAIWLMGNLGRAGYGASLDGMWPYSYDTCDVGTVKNQTKDGLPIAATNTGPKDYQFSLSYLPGQRLSRCTCPGESHPGPVHENQEYVGRSAPEIDIFEAEVDIVDDPDNPGEQLKFGGVSQSSQWAPFNHAYGWLNTSEFLTIPDLKISRLNSYQGAVYQQATSVVTETDPNAYELNGGQYSIYGVQYQPGFDNAYITWISSGQLAWSMKQGGMAPDPEVEIGQRIVPREPMYLIANLGISPNFGDIDWDHIKFPATMKVDWIRVYQDPDMINYGCDPADFPTQAYIKTYPEAYNDPLLTTWVDDYKQVIPRNKFLGQC